MPLSHLHIKQSHKSHERPYLRYEVGLGLLIAAMLQLRNGCHRVYVVYGGGGGYSSQILVGMCRGKVINGGFQMKLERENAGLWSELRELKRENAGLCSELEELECENAGLRNGL